MFKNLLSKVGWGELPSSFGFTIGEKVELPFQWNWELHKGVKKSDGSAVSVFICAKKDLDSAQVAAGKNAEQMGKSLRHPNILKALDSIEIDSGFYLVTEPVVPLLSVEEAEEESSPEIWGLYQALDALGFLHQSGFSHGLFGPLTIFVTARGDFRVGAFELCRKGHETCGSIIAARRQIGPSAVGWPEPPAALADQPSKAVDAWGAALLASYVYGRGRKPEASRLQNDLPAELRGSFADLQRGRGKPGEVGQLPYFQNHPAVQVMSFLGSLQIRSSEEKEKFFDSLLGLLEQVPKSVQTRQVLPELLAAQSFPGQEGAQVLPAILKIGTKLKEEEFKEKVAPLVLQLFSSPDRGIRFRLLSSMGEMIGLLDDAMVNDKIFPECVNGFTDSSAPIREATVKALIHFVPRLKPKTVEQRCVKLLTKMLSDPEASIRTNSVICCGRVSGYLPKEAANQALGAVLAAGLKDSFPPCRSASLQTLLATASVFSAEELAGRLLPGVCQRLVDPDCGVSNAAFNVLSSLQEHIKSELEERRNASAQAADAPPPPAAAEGQAGWGSWAFSTVGNVVGNKLMGSMGPAKRDSERLDTVAAAAAQPQPPPPNGAPRGVSLGPQVSAAPAPIQEAGAPGAGLDLDGGGVEAAGWGEEEDFWDDFGDLPTEQAAIKEPSPKAAPKAKAEEKKPMAQPLAAGKDDEDFWKEFDM